MYLAGICLLLEALKIYIKVLGVEIKSIHRGMMKEEQRASRNGRQTQDRIETENGD